MKNYKVISSTILVLLTIMFSPSRSYSQTCNITVSNDTSICLGDSITLTATGAHIYTWTPGPMAGSSVVVSPLTTTVYTVIGTDTVLTCNDTAYITVTVNPLPTVSYSLNPNDTVCSGTSITLNGTGAVTYLWTGGVIDGIPFIASSTNTYHVTGTDFNGCSNTDSVTITVNPSPTLTTNSDTAICIGSSVSLNASGADSYIWNPGAVPGPSLIVTPSATITYTVTGTEAVNGCTSTETVTVTVNNLPNVSYLASPNDSICIGDNVTLSGTGASTYVWSGGVLDGIPFTPPLPSNTYVVTGTDVNGCSNTDTAIVVVNPLPFVNFTFTPSTSVCSGTNVTLWGNGASTYSWTGGISDGVPFVPLTSTTYTVTGTDVYGCSNTAQVTITVKPLPTIMASNDTSICFGATSMIGAAGADTYVWNPGAIPGSLISVSPSTTTTYTVTGTDTITGCSNDETVTITVNPLPIVGYTSFPNDTVCLGSSITLNGTGADTYSWTGGVLNGVPFIPASSGGYIVTGTDLNGCINMDTAIITVNPLPVIGYTVVFNDTVCMGDDVILSGTGGTSYTWTGGIIDSAPFTAMATATYTVTGTDINGCTNTTQASIYVNPLPTVGHIVSPNDTVCSGTNVTLSGTGAVSYSWNGGVINSIPFVADSTYQYYVTGIDSNGCKNTDSTWLIVNPSPSLIISPDTSICTGDSIQLNASGATSYIWSPGTGLNDSTIANPVAGPNITTTYIIIGTNPGGCVDSATVTITVNPNPVVGYNITPNDTICSGSSVTLSGTGAISYTWSGGIVDGIAFTPITSGSYSVIGTDINGCIDSTVADIVINPLPSVSYTSAPGDSICAGSSLTLSGTGANTYAWTGGVTDGIPFTPGSSGAYIVTGTDLNGCSSTDTVDITIIPLPVIGIVASPDTVICTGSSVVLNGTGGTTYSWNNGVTDGIAFTPLATNTYTVVSNNGAGCIDSAAVTIHVNPLPPVSYTVFPNDSVCFGDSVTFSGSTTYSYSWTGGVADGIPFIPVSNSTYTVTVTDSNGCANTASQDILVHSLPVLGMSSNSPVCFGSPLNLSATGGSVFNWTGPNGFSSGLQNPVIPSSSLLNSGDYILQINDSNGCAQIDSINISIIVPPTGLIDVLPGTGICIGDSIQLSAVVGSGSYLWNTGDTNNVIIASPTMDTTYALTMTNPFFCNGQVMDFININVYPLPSANIVSSNGDSICSGAATFLTATGGDNYQWNFGATSPGIFITPSSDTTFTVIVSTINGCSDTASYNIYTHANPLPPSINASSNVICSGGSVELSTNLSNGILWSPIGSTNDTVIVTAGGTYQVNYTDANGCTSSNSINITESTLNATIMGDTMACPGATISLTALGGTSYMWSTGDSLAQINVQPDSVTSYSVTALDSIGCADQASVVVYPFWMLNVDPIANNDSMSININAQGFIDVTLNDANYTGITVISDPVHGNYILNTFTIEYTPDPGFTGTDSIQYVICSDVCGQVCDTAWLFIQVTSGVPVSIPQVVTPNGDFFNDQWVISNLDLFPENEIIIMNRWGDIVFQAQPYNNDWNGQSNTGIHVLGDMLSSGTYYYVVKLNATTEPLKGFIELIK